MAQISQNELLPKCIPFRHRDYPNGFKGDYRHPVVAIRDEAGNFVRYDPAPRGKQLKKLRQHLLGELSYSEQMKIKLQFAYLAKNPKFKHLTE